MRLTDGSRLVEISMRIWDENRQQYNPDFSNDFFADDLEYDDDLEAWKVEDVQYCIDYANDWANGKGDFLEEKEEPEVVNGNRCVDVDELEMPKKDMSKREVIEKNRDALAEEMVGCYRDILKSGGRIRYDIYIWSDGEIEPLQLTSSGNGWLQAKESETRELYFVGTVKIDEFYFDPWDCYPDPKPEDEEEAERIEKEIIDECVEDFDPDEIIDEAIENAEEESEDEDDE